MPVILTSEASFQGLQAAVAQAKASLDKVYQIASVLEARASKAEQGTQSPTPPPPRPSPAGDDNQGLAEMLRIAGLRN
jgi:hypothetical protein